VVAVLGAVVYFQPCLEPEQDTQKLTTLLPEEVEKIIIERDSKENISLNNQQVAWFITSPIEVAANSFRIEPLLQFVQSSSQARFEKASLDLAKYKLDQPAVTIHLNDIEIAFGDSEPLKKRRYVRVGNIIHLVSDIYYYRLLTDVAGFANTGLLPEGARISKIETPGFQLEYSEHGRWSVVPEEGEVSADAINTLLDKWRHAQAMQVSPYESSQSLGSVVVHIENSPALQFTILEQDPEFILGRDDIGMQYHFTAGQGQQLMQLPSSEDLMGDREPEAIVDQ